MEYIKLVIDFVLHIDVHLSAIIQDYGVWTYLLLFIIIFCETGLVIAPYFPGDSLLFAAGTFSAINALDIRVLLIILIIAAVGGDTVNYSIGHLIGEKIFKRDKIPLLNKKSLDQAHQFFERYGGKAIILARFIPIIRTFVPFVAGIGSMTYWKFVNYNVIGGIAWVTIFLLAGYFFGNLPAVKNNFSLVIIAIIIISVLPAVREFLRSRLANKKKL